MQTADEQASLHVGSRGLSSATSHEVTETRSCAMNDVSKSALSPADVLSPDPVTQLRQQHQMNILLRSQLELLEENGKGLRSDIETLTQRLSSGESRVTQLMEQLQNAEVRLNQLHTHTGWRSASRLCYTDLYWCIPALAAQRHNDADVVDVGLSA